MSIPKPLFSLTRFCKEKPKLPCWVAGRFFKLDSQSYLLKSQGLIFFCKSIKPIQEYKEGSRAAVQLVSQISTTEMRKIAEFVAGYKTEEFVLLQSPLNSYKEKNFSYQKIGLIFLKSKFVFEKKKAMRYIKWSFIYWNGIVIFIL